MIIFLLLMWVLFPSIFVRISLAYALLYLAIPQEEWQMRLLLIIPIIITNVCIYHSGKIKNRFPVFAEIWLDMY